MTTRKVASWWKRIAAIWLILFIITAIAYSIGANSVSKSGATIHIDRSADYTLLRLNDTAALYCKPKYEEVSLVSYKPAFPLFRMLGKYSYNREIVNGPLALQGAWFYNLKAAIYDPGRIIAYNYKTGEKLLKQEPADLQNMNSPAAFVERGWSPDPGLEIKPEQAFSSFEPLSVPKESAISVMMGFLLAGVLWLLVLPFAFRKVQVKS